MSLSVLNQELERRATPARNLPGVSVVIPVFNEEAAIAETLRTAREVLRDEPRDYEIIVVNDGSTDQTGTILQQTFAWQDVRVVEHPRNQGYGAALKTGIRHARYPWIAIVDADGSYPLAKLPTLTRLTADVDMVVGARTGADASPPGLRGLARSLLRHFAQWLARRRIPDMNSGLRVFRKDLAERFLRVLPDGFSFTTTITLAMLTNGFRVHFEPIPYYRRIGCSKIHPVRDTFNFFRLIVRTAVYFAPLRVFLPVAMLFLMGFFATFVWDLLVQHEFSLRSLLLLVASTQLGLFAMLADMIDKRCG